MWYYVKLDVYKKHHLDVVVPVRRELVGVDSLLVVDSCGLVERVLCDD